MLPRLAWLALFAVHLLPAVAVGRRLIAGGGASDWLSMALLLASMTLFALKTAGAPFLRLPASRAGRVAVLLVAALLHHDALGLSANADARAALLAAPAAVLVIASTPADVRRRLRAAGRTVDRLVSELLAIAADFVGAARSGGAGTPGLCSAGASPAVGGGSGAGCWSVAAAPRRGPPVG